MRADQFDFVDLRSRFAGKPPTQILFHQLDIFWAHEIAQGPTHDFRRSHSQQGKETRVGEQNLFTVDQNGVVNRLDQALKQLFAVGEVGAALLQVLQQFIDRGTQLPQRLRCALESETARGAWFEREAPDLFRKLAERK